MMRAMRQTFALCALVLLVGGCGDDNGNGGPDMSMPDLAPGPDLAVRMPNGVVCGSATCAVGQSCCVTVSGMTTTAACLPAGGNCAGAALACDGPEDCSSAMQYCCGMITFTGGTNPDAGAPMFQGGNASCAGTCDFNFVQGPPSQVTTRMCSIDDDCTGLSAFGGSVMLNKCCSSTQAPGLHFCAAALGFGGVTCP
jgi:hypothetical protein